MNDLSPVAFDIETSGLDADAVVTVAGFSHELGHWLFLNTAGRDADEATLTQRLETESETPVSLEVVPAERALLEALSEFAEERVDGDSHYLTAYNGETWNGGFDLPFLRSACHRNGVQCPFGDLAYADTMEMMDRFDTGDTRDLVGVYDLLVGEDSCDPFDESQRAVAAFEAGDWRPLLQHNLADIMRTRELAELAGRFVPRSDFQMKNLEPPR
jgi:uncharacterized protein YprB with RNaseH-like and TPR domain